MLKHELRKLYLQMRMNLSVQERTDFNMKIKSQFNNFLSHDIKTVHTYLPITSKAEIDTWPIIHELWSKNIQVVVPVMETGKNLLRSYLLTQETSFKVNGWEIPEPLNSPLIANNLVDAVIVPLLAFDKIGYRVGYGKGYYDTFLSSVKKEALKIGLSYFPAVDKISNPDPWDIPLDVCITPHKLFTF